MAHRAKGIINSYTTYISSLQPWHTSSVITPLTPIQRTSMQHQIRHQQHNTTQHNTTQHSTTQHNTTQHNTTQRNATQRNATQRNATRRSTRRPRSFTHHIIVTQRLIYYRVTSGAFGESCTQNIPPWEYLSLSPSLTSLYSCYYYILTFKMCPVKCEERSRHHQSKHWSALGDWSVGAKLQHLFWISGSPFSSPSLLSLSPLPPFPLPSSHFFKFFIVLFGFNLLLQDDYHYITTWYSHIPLLTTRQKDCISHHFPLLFISSFSFSPFLLTFPLPLLSLLL